MPPDANGHAKPPRLGSFINTSSHPSSSSSEARSQPYPSPVAHLPMPSHSHYDAATAAPPVADSPRYHHAPSAFHPRHFSSEPHSAKSEPGSAVEPPRHPPMYHDHYRLSTDPQSQAPYPPPPPPPPQSSHPDHHGPRQVAPPPPPPPPYDPHRSAPYPGPPPPPQSQQPQPPPPPQPPQHNLDLGPYDSYGYGLQADGQAARRKAVRASQACDPCRSKKCKCDEVRPTCGNCAATGTVCAYREVPPPKQERTLLQVMEQIAALASEVADMKHVLNIFPREFHDFRDEVRMRLGGPPSSHDQQQQRRTDWPRSANAPQASHHTAHRNIAPAYSPSGSVRSEHSSRGTPHQQPGRIPPQHMDVDTETLKGWDPQEGGLSIPYEHTTAAHKLLISWDAIKPLYRGILTPEYAKDYVMSEEKQRGMIRPFGQGEGHDTYREASALAANNPHHRGPVYPDHSAAQTPADGFWGFGFDGPAQRPADTVGGLNWDGTLNLDYEVCCRLFDNFMTKMWVMHPFINKTHLQNVFATFARKNCTGFKRQASAHPNFSTGAGIKPESPIYPRTAKRKRSDAFQEDPDTPAASSDPDGLRRAPLQRSVNNALMLMVFAVGSICEHRDPLPAPVPSEDTAQSDAHLHVKSPTPPNGFKTTPTSSFNHLDTSGMSRTPSNDSYSTPGRYAKKMRNIDRIPGFAYHTYAVGILGEQHGGADLAHVHAQVLAGLFFGQLARVIDSWRWIHTACVSCQLLFKDEKQLEKDMPPERADAIRFAFWTCLQLERYEMDPRDPEHLQRSVNNLVSDILAELDVPASQISTFEDRMSLPAWTTDSYADGSEDQLILVYYNAQISIRRILNRAHSALYNSSKGKLPNPGWSTINAGDLIQQLADWRKHLPRPLQWEEYEEPPSDINAARLRAKYYGAKYMIHRPFLHHILQDEFAPKQRNARGDAPPASETDQKQDIVGRAKTCVEAAFKSTYAFDGVESRPIVTNIFGTAHAQFGNALVLCACYTSRKHRWFVPKHELDQLLERTIRFVGAVAHLAPTMATNVRILRNAAQYIRNEVEDPHPGPAAPDTPIGVSGPASNAGSSFVSHHS